MKKTPLEKALSLLSRRKFYECLEVLEPAQKLYLDNFNYYLVGGLACLYMDDFGSAKSYFDKARQYRQTDPSLLLGQAVLFLRYGDTARATQYYLDILDIDPRNRIAKRALSFIREKGTYEEIYRLIDSNALKRFYPPLGPNPSVILGILSALGLALAVFALLFVFTRKFSREIRFSNSGNGLLAEDFSISTEEMRNVVVAEYAEGEFAYILSEREVESTYKSLYAHATEPVRGDQNLHRTNLAVSEANVILNSNASEIFKVKSQQILDAIESDREHEPTFGTLLDNFSCEDVLKDPLRYDGCWVIWTGMLANPESADSGYRCDFLVWDDSMTRFYGRYDLIFPKPPAVPVSGDRVVQILAKISLVEGDDGSRAIRLTEKADSVLLRNQGKVQEMNQDSQK